MDTENKMDAENKIDTENNGFFEECGISFDTEKNRVEKGKLYLVSTPIGNLEDMTFRALKVLKGVDFIAAEDTRVTGKLLKCFKLTGSIITYQEHNKRKAGQTIVRRLKEGESCALVTDAGTPAISDPGEDIVRLCIENEIDVVPVPGACAAVTALTVSGFSTLEFAFEGFLKGTKNESREKLEALKNEKRTMIFYEAPHRLTDTLMLMAEVFGGGRRVCLLRELTKLNEEKIRTTLDDAVKMFSERQPRGEFVIVTEGSSGKEVHFWDVMTIPEHVAYYEEKLGLKRMDAMKAAAKDRGVGKSVIYDAVTEDKAEE